MDKPENTSQENNATDGKPSELGFSLPRSGDSIKKQLVLRGAGTAEPDQLKEVLPKLSLSAFKAGDNSSPLQPSNSESKKQELEPTESKPTVLKTERQIPELDSGMDLKVDLEQLFSKKLSLDLLPESFASVASGSLLLMHGRNETLQKQLGIVEGLHHSHNVKFPRYDLHWTDGSLKVAKLLAVPTLAIAGTNIYTDSKKFMSGEFNKPLYGTALAFDSLAASGSIAQLVSKKPWLPITCLGLVGRAIMGGVESYLKK